MSSSPEHATKYLAAINEGLAHVLETDDRVVLMGIDVGAGDGIFKVTRGLHERFGSSRVMDTPISEMGYVGAAVGAAMTGLRPIVEIMFMDFIGVCLDPIMNQAAKLHYMTAGAVEIPIVFRTQTGAGRSAGAQHSQSLEAMIAHIPGLKVVMPATVSDAYDLLVAAVEDPDPVVYIENRRLYGLRGARGQDPLPLGRARVSLPGDDVTVVTWGQMVRECEKAATTAQASVEVIDLRSLVPLDWETVLSSAGRTGRALVVHEAVQDFGAGAEIAARLGEELFDVLRAPVKRIGTPPVPMPFNPDLERAVLPQAAAVAAACERLVHEG
jgi:pyruvate/2-oxoglutarate/acetoin dehydrogenase E1 component